VIGTDEISISKDHTYRIAVSDLLRQRPISFGGEDRSEESLDASYGFLAPPTAGLQQRGRGTEVLRELARLAEMAAPETLRGLCEDDRASLGRSRCLLEPENKVPLGFIKSLNNKIPVIQRRSCGLRCEEYLSLKVLTCMQPKFNQKTGNLAPLDYRKIPI
jgi:hypothetical protein